MQNHDEWATLVTSYSVELSADIVTAGLNLAWRYVEASNDPAMIQDRSTLLGNIIDHHIRIRTGATLLLAAALIPALECEVIRKEDIRRVCGSEVLRDCKKIESYYSAIHSITLQSKLDAEATEFRNSTTSGDAEENGVIDLTAIQYQVSRACAAALVNHAVTRFQFLLPESPDGVHLRILPILDRVRRMEQLITRVSGYNERVTVSLLWKAYSVAEAAHLSQWRKDLVTPYMDHPIAVTDILADWKADTPTLAAGLLHDAVEDNASVTSRHLLEVFGSKIGPEIQSIVEGVTHITRQLEDAREVNGAQAGLSGTQEKQRQRARAIRINLNAGVKDPRTLILKLADRLHNMRTLQALNDESRQRISRETLYVFGPAAGDLGMQAVKRELEDIAFAGCYPEEFRRIERLMASVSDERSLDAEEVTGRLIPALERRGVQSEVQVRWKRPVRIWKKQSDGRAASLDEISDLLVARVVVESEEDCDLVLAIIPRVYPVIRDAPNNFVWHTKGNLYRSVHVNVMGRSGRSIQLQVLTRQMQKEAETGILCYWDRREGVKADRRFRCDMRYVHRYREWDASSPSDPDFIEKVFREASIKQILVRTPDNQGYELPHNATPLDLAHKIHPTLMLQCVEALVNGVIKPLTHPLQNFDAVRLITSEGAKPHRSWITVVKTDPARNRLSAWFDKYDHHQDVIAGQVLIEAAILEKSSGSVSKVSPELLSMIYDSFGAKNVEELLAKTGRREVAPSAVATSILYRDSQSGPSMTQP